MWPGYVSIRKYSIEQNIENMLTHKCQLVLLIASDTHTYLWFLSGCAQGSVWLLTMWSERKDVLFGCILVILHPLLHTHTHTHTHAHLRCINPFDRPYTSQRQSIMSCPPPCPPTSHLPLTHTHMRATLPLSSNNNHLLFLHWIHSEA